jgi:hypothetical protein
MWKCANIQQPTANIQFVRRGYVAGELGIGFSSGNIFTLATFSPSQRKHLSRMHLVSPFCI